MQDEEKSAKASDLKKGTCIVFDTETTGMDIEDGHRVIEIGAVKYKNERLVDRFHAYIDPGREVDRGAAEVHGWNWESLQEKSGGRKFDSHMRDDKYSEPYSIAEKFIEFCEDGLLVAHNSPFDTKFLDNEYDRAGYGERFISKNFHVFDTLHQYAKLIRPRQKNDLDTLCKVYKVDNARRDLHGALLDAELLSSVYFEMVNPQNDNSIKAQQRSSMKLSKELKPISKTPVSEDPGIIIEPSAKEKNQLKGMTEGMGLG